MPDFLRKNSLFLAPMSGVTDPAFRTICRKMGADVCVSEFVYSRAVLLKIPKILDKLRFEESSRPYGIQLFGSDPVEVADAASLIEELFAPDFIDLNFGCPAPNAVDAGAGAALLKNPKKMAEIARTVAGKLKSVPLTAKLRTGWSHSQIIVPDAAFMLEDSGVKLLALHGRTKTQGYSGEADWDLINKTASAVKIPLIGNGSVQNLSAEELSSSPCFGFMIGRAAIGNPWVFQELKAKLNGSSYVQPGASSRVCCAISYLEALLNNSKFAPPVDAKRNILGFLKGHAGFKKMRETIANEKLSIDLLNLLKNFKQQLDFETQ